MTETFQSYAKWTACIALIASASVLLIQGNYSKTSSSSSSNLLQPRSSRRASISMPETIQKKPLVQPSDSVYNFHVGPIVIEEHKLLFFYVPKVACSVFKQLLRRMMGYEDWHDFNANLHYDYGNGLKKLSEYTLEEANDMMTSDEWTRAMFVREPKERYLSAFMDKCLNEGLCAEACCSDRLLGYSRWSKEECDKQLHTLEGFIEAYRYCQQEHWTPQANRVERKYWPYMTFIGHMHSIQEDAEKLLRLLGDDVWEKYGASGWGEKGDEPIFQSTGTVKHATGSVNYYQEYYTPELERKVEKIMERDYQSDLFDFSLEEMDAS